jgi:5-methylcytosine-specific restriction enzyme A
MATELTQAQWAEILTHPKLTNIVDLSIFQTLYSFENHKAYASQIGLMLGYKGKSPHAPLNLEIGKYAKRISKFYDIHFTERASKKYKYWDLFFNGWEEDRFFVWQLKTELIKALESCELTGEILGANEFPYNNLTLSEGVKKTVIVNSYERNPIARRICISHWGKKCSICDFDFYKSYGSIGLDFIHVHHLIPVSEVGKAYQVDPIADLRPVCPNCHAMLHTSNPPLSIEQLRELFYTKK